MRMYIHIEKKKHYGSGLVISKYRLNATKYEILQNINIKA